MNPKKIQYRLTMAEANHVFRLIEELEAVIDADDEAVIPWQLCEDVAVVKEIMQGARYEV